MKFLIKRRLQPIGLLAALGLAFLAGSAWADGNALDQANASVTAALQALKLAPASGDTSKFEAHRKKATTLLTRAQGEILKAKRLSSLP